MNDNAPSLHDMLQAPTRLDNYRDYMKLDRITPVTPFTLMEPDRVYIRNQRRRNGDDSMTKAEIRKVKKWLKEGGPFPSFSKTISTNRRIENTNMAIPKFHLNEWLYEEQIERLKEVFNWNTAYNKNLRFRSNFYFDGLGKTDYVEVNLKDCSFYNFKRPAVSGLNICPLRFDGLEKIIGWFTGLFLTKGYINPVADVHKINFRLSLFRDNRETLERSIRIHTVDYIDASSKALVQTFIFRTDWIRSLDERHRDETLKSYIRNLAYDVTRRFEYAYKQMFVSPMNRDREPIYDDDGLTLNRTHVYYEGNDFINVQLRSVSIDGSDTTFSDGMFFLNHFFDTLKISVIRSNALPRDTMPYLPLAARGGCFGLLTLPKSLRDRIKPHVYDPMTKENDLKGRNDCFFKEISRYFDLEIDSLRLKYNMRDDELVSISMARKILIEEFDTFVDFFVFSKNEKFTDLELNCQSLSKDKIFMALIYNHYYTVKSSFDFEMIRSLSLCPSKCGKYYLSCKEGPRIRHESGKCSNSKKRKREKKLDLTPGEVGRVKRFKFHKKTSLSKCWFADLETFGRDIHEVYASAIVNGDIHSTPIIFYGEKSLPYLCDFIIDLSKEKKAKKNDYHYVYFFNGSGFDMMFLFQNFFHRGEDMTNILMQGTKILSMKLNDSVIFRDMYLFTMCSLDRACKEFGVDESLSKKSFDHTLINSYEDAEEHELIIKEYLEMDVISLRELFKIYRDDFYDMNEIDITQCITISQAAYLSWSKSIPSNIMIHDAGMDEHIRKSYFGGRVMPIVKKYKSSEYDSWESYEKMTDFFVDIDVVSLYAKAMQDFKYFYGSIETVTDYSSCEKLKEILNDGTSLFKNNIIVCCDVRCNTGIYLPLLPERRIDRIVYDLSPKMNQSYCIDELIFSIKHGYIVDKIHYFLKFSDDGFIFKDYIKSKMKIKKSSKKGTARYALSKLEMNTVYGKTAQRRIRQEKKVYHCEEEFLKDADKGKIESFTPITTESGMASFIAECISDNSDPSKPVYLASQITSNSRLHTNMLLEKTGCFYDPEKMFHYTDTDSFVVHNSIVDILENEGVIGKEIGMLDDELEGGKIIKAIYLAPKTYILEYVLPDNKVYWKVRCKGIPHFSGKIEKKDYEITKEEGEKRISSLDLKKQCYKLISLNDIEDPRYFENITMECFEKLSNETHNVIGYFGSFKREVSKTKKDGIVPDIITQIRRVEGERTINNASWWRDNFFRELDDHESYNVVSKPKGFNKILFT